jgi:hypothetical protein
VTHTQSTDRSIPGFTVCQVRFPPVALPFHHAYLPAEPRLYGEAEHHEDNLENQYIHRYKLMYRLSQSLAAGILVAGSGEHAYAGMENTASASEARY